jgi:hypothetical protein
LQPCAAAAAAAAASAISCCIRCCLYRSIMRSLSDLNNCSCPGVTVCPPDPNP